MYSAYNTLFICVVCLFVCVCFSLVEKLLSLYLRQVPLVTVTPSPADEEQQQMSSEHSAHDEGDVDIVVDGPQAEISSPATQKSTKKRNNNSKTSRQRESARPSSPSTVTDELSSSSMLLSGTRLTASVFSAALKSLVKVGRNTVAVSI